MRARERRKYRWLPFAAAAMMLVTAFWAVDRELRRAVSEKVRYRVEVLAMEMMAESVAEGLAGAGALSELSVDSTGRVTAIEINVRETARIQTSILRRLTAAISQESNETVAVPLGNLLSGEWFSERGPGITFTFEPEEIGRAHV